MNKENLSIRVRCCLIVKDKYLFIEQQTQSKTLLLFPGGGIESGESMVEGCLREIREEIGVFLPRSTHFSLRGVREIVVTGFYRCIEFYFSTELEEVSIGHLSADENILSATLYSLEELMMRDPKPDFWREMLTSNSAVYVSDCHSLEEYVEKFGNLPNPGDHLEMVHVMLKPDTVQCGNEESVIADLIEAGGTLVYQKKMSLSLDQIKVIYFDFTFDSARDLVFRYLTENQTVHLAFVGPVGLHVRMNELKGKTGGSTGLRGRYIKNYTRVVGEMFQMWVDGNHPDQDAISLEMFCCNVLHVAPDARASYAGLRSILL